MADLRVVVLGGGACGMTAAHALAREGAAVTVLEREERVGGLCGTIERDGFRFDLGGHRFLSRNPELEAMVRALCGEDLLLRKRSSMVLHGGHRYRYPLELDDVLSQVGIGRGARIVGSYVGQRLRRKKADHTFEQWVTHRFGSELYDQFFGPYTEKLWGIPPSEISADWASQRISLLSLGDVLLRLFGMRNSATRTYARSYLYPRLGIGQIFERMGAAFTSDGGTLRLGARVTGMVVRADRVAAVRYRDARGEHELPCDGVISTLALPQLAKMVAGRVLPWEIADAASRLRFRAIRLCNVTLDRPDVSPHTWMYVSEPRYLMSRIQEPRRRSPAAAPEGKSSLMLEIPCTVGDATWTAPQEAIYQRCMDDLKALGFGDLRRDTRAHFASYVEEGYPIYHLDYQRQRRQLLDFVGEKTNLISCGRQGAFRYVFMDTAMEMGIAAARALLDGAGARRAISEMRSERGLVEARAHTA